MIKTGAEIKETEKCEEWKNDKLVPWKDKHMENPELNELKDIENSN